MGTLLASVIIDRVRATLVDPNGVGWSDDELYDYLSAAESAVCNAKPDAYTKLESVGLVAGPVQSLPDDAIQLFAVYYNTSDGSVINQVGIDLLNRATPAWPGSVMADIVEEYMTDERRPSGFLVNPPNDGTGAVMAFYGAEPPAFAVGSPSQVIHVKDSHQTALWAYTCSLAYAKNTKRADVVKSNNMMAMFNQLLGLRAAGQKASAPKLDNTEPA